jgi:hypothetical protein
MRGGYERKWALRVICFTQISLWRAGVSPGPLEGFVGRYRLYTEEVDLDKSPLMSIWRSGPGDVGRRGGGEGGGGAGGRWAGGAG